TAWVGILALIAVLYPLLRMVPSYRKTMFDISASDKYGEIFGLARQIDQATSTQALERLEARFGEIEHDVMRRLWVPKGCNQSYYFLSGSLDVVRERLALAHSRIIGDQSEALIALPRRSPALAQ
ncbi:MAG: hypothetical protein H2060_12910, partial [Azoarcus sp.]|nr:hypothetical protein [Azoarcus sp.]